MNKVKQDWESLAKHMAKVVVLEHIPLLKQVADNCDIPIKQGDIMAMSYKIATEQRQEDLSKLAKTILES